MKKKLIGSKTRGAKKASSDFVVASDPGLYLLPAAILARTARRFDSEIMVSNGDLSVDAKSALGLMSLCATKGTVLGVTARGGDCTEALKAIENFLIAPFRGRARSDLAAGLQNRAKALAESRRERAERASKYAPAMA